MDRYAFDLDVSLNSLKDKQVRLLDAVEFMLNEKTSLRRVARECCLSKSTLHRFITYDLKFISDDAYVQLKPLLRRNYIERNNRALFPQKIRSR